MTGGQGLELVKILEPHPHRLRSWSPVTFFAPYEALLPSNVGTQGTRASGAGAPAEYSASDYKRIAVMLSLAAIQIFAFVNLYGCEIGDGTKIGTFVEIQKERRLGRCKIGSHTFICEASQLNPKFSSDTV